MRPILHGDVTAAARVLFGAPPGGRPALLERLMLHAERADAWRRRTGRAHPRWGDGSLMAAALALGPPAEPPLSDADYCGCLALVFEALVARRCG